MLAQDAATPPDTAVAVTLIQGATVFDGESVIGKQDVLIEGERIVKIGADLDVPPGAEVVDASGRFLMPGLIDCHTHTFAKEELEYCLLFGVTTVCDMFTVIPALDAMRASTGPHQADILSAGVLVTAPRGHGTQFGVAIPTITEAAEADAFVQARLDEGSDFIKIVYDNGRSMGFSKPTISLETLTALVAAAHARDVMAVAHIHDYQSAGEAVRADIDGLVHTFIDELPENGTLAQAMVERETFIVPTLAVIESVCGHRGGRTLVNDPNLSPFIDTAHRMSLEQTFSMPADGPALDYSIAKKSVGWLNDAGVVILAGTDAPNPGTAHGVSMHRELELLVEAGLSSEQALRAATGNAARSFGMDDRGRIEEGRLADLVLLDGDPMEAITDTRRIHTVWKRGVAVDRQAATTRIAGEREDAEVAEAEAVNARGLVSDFEGGEITSGFGSGWEISTDQLMGGTSSAVMSLAEEGAQGSAGSLLVKGNLAGEFTTPWAGVMFSPGSATFQPANLKANTGFAFDIRGDGRQYRVLVFAQALGRIPGVQTFTTEQDWQTIEFTFEQFNNIDGSGLMAIIFTAAENGPFEFAIDNVTFK